ncbi:MAG: CDGSH iron-sulfur domain-containing protein [Phycisphaerales bacterium]
MPRLVRHDADGPIKIEVRDKPVFVCACGLSKTFPICDGSHKGCVNETPGVVSVYDAKRERVIEEREE